MDLFEEIPEELRIKMASGVSPASPFAFWSWFLPLLLAYGVFALPVVVKAISNTQKSSRPHANQRAEVKHQIQAEASR